MCFLLLLFNLPTVINIALHCVEVLPQYSCSAKPSQKKQGHSILGPNTLVPLLKDPWTNELGLGMMTTKQRLSSVAQ